MKFQLADATHEEGLRDLFRRSRMPGWIRLAFCREPDFFHAVGVQGKFNQVLIAIEGERVIGMGCRSVKPMWVDGRRMDIGYLSGLRLAPEVRRTGALARVYAFCKVLHERGPVPAYLTTVVESNREAAALLTSGRAGLPHYLDRGRYFTYAVSLNARRRRTQPRGLAVRNGDSLPLEDIVAFLNRCGSRRQFFPAIDAADFGTGYLRGLRREDIRVAVGGNEEIVGAAAVWDQGGFKQNVVEGYATPVQWSRPAVNGLLCLAGFSRLPAPGECLNILHAAFCCVRDDDGVVLRALLERICTEHRDGRHHFLVVGFHERDPLKAVMVHFPAFRYTSRFYLACWDDGLAFVNSLDPRRIPFLEAAAL